MSTPPLPSQSATPRLTEPQRTLLSNLFNTDWGSLCLRGRDIRMGQRLVDLGLAQWSPGSRWCELTPAGRDLHRTLWEARNA